MAVENLRESVKRICARADRIAARTPAAYLAAMVRYMEPEPDEPRAKGRRFGGLVCPACGSHLTLGRCHGRNCPSRTPQTKEG